MQRKLEQLQEVSPRTGVTYSVAGLTALWAAGNLLCGDKAEGLSFLLASGALIYVTDEYKRLPERYGQVMNFFSPPAPKRREPAQRREPAPEPETPRAGM